MHFPSWRSRIPPVWTLRMRPFLFHPFDKVDMSISFFFFFPFYYVWLFSPLCSQNPFFDLKALCFFAEFPDAPPLLSFYAPLVQPTVPFLLFIYKDFARPEPPLSRHSF